MKLYITKPEPWDIAFDGVGRVTIWFERPVYYDGWRYNLDDWFRDEDKEGNAKTKGHWEGRHFNPVKQGITLSGYLFRRHDDPEMQKIMQAIWEQVVNTYVPSAKDEGFLTLLLDMERAGCSCEKPGMSHKEWVGEIDVEFKLSIVNSGEQKETQ